MFSTIWEKKWLDCICCVNSLIKLLENCSFFDEGDFHYTLLPWRMCGCDGHLQAVLLDVGSSLAVCGQHGLKTLWRAIARENSEDRLTLQLVTGLSRGTRYFRASIAPCADNVKYRRLIRTFLAGMWCLLSQEQRAKLKIYSHLSKHAGVSTLAFRELL